MNPLSADSYVQSRPIQILLVDDHNMVRQGLRCVLAQYPDIEIAAEAADGEEAVRAVEGIGTCVVVMDVNMPRMNGVQATAAIKAKHPHVEVVGLTVNADSFERPMLDVGAHSVVAKGGPADDLYRAIVEAAVNRFTTHLARHATFQ